VVVCIEAPKGKAVIVVVKVVKSEDVADEGDPPPTPRGRLDAEDKGDPPPNPRGRPDAKDEGDPPPSGRPGIV
jgi:hypothetical protein